jgi:hypothetical protein
MDFVILECCNWVIYAIAVLAIWELVWKFIALWKAAKNNHLVWFICIVVINTAGILPIIYLLLSQKKKEE